MRRSISGAAAGVIAAFFALCVAAPGVGAEDAPVVGPDQQATSWTGPTLSAGGSVPYLIAPSPVGPVPPSPQPYVSGYAHHYFVKVDVDISYWATHTGGLEVRIEPESEGTNLDVYVYRGRWEEQPNDTAPSEGPVASGDNEVPGEEVAFVDRAVGEYTIRVVYKQGAPSAYRGLAVFTSRAGRDDAATFNNAEALTFEPASIVSAHFLGPEPMVTMERPVAGFEQATDPDRIFVDWPLSPLEKIGQLSRSEDGGESFRLLYDPDCARFSRPTCVAEGGSDTHAEVNPTTGMLYFSAQVLVAGESFSASSDHGDTFPEALQQSQVNTATGSDRQWVAPAGTGFDTAAGTVKAFLAYHVPQVAQFIHGVDASGKVLPQQTAQILNVVQSGPLHVDTTGGPGHGWIYQPYQGFTDDQRGTAIRVATAPAADYSSPTAWKRSIVATRTPVIFPWLDLDSDGNAYMVWVDDVSNKLVYSVSPIADPRNDPTLESLPGRPGTYWTDAVEISGPEVGTAIFPEVVGGGPGRFGIAYMGTEDYQGPPDEAPATTRWHAYGAVVSDALAEGDSPPVVTTGRVSHRVAHTGTICTGGPTGCDEANEDFSLADMIDVGVDRDGRLGVVFSDNNSRFAAPLPGQAVKQRPFDHFAKQVSGPALFTGASLPPVPNRSHGDDPAGDATWPNTVAGRSFPALDATDAQLSLEGDDLVARIPLRSTGFGADLTSFNSVASSNPPADRLQFVLRYLTDKDIYHLSMEFRNGNRRFFGGILDDNDRLLDDETVRGAGYHTDGNMPVRGAIENGALVLRGKASDFGIVDGTKVYSVTAFTMAGPSEARETTIFDVMRTIDATPPFDATLTRITPSPSISPKGSSSASPAVSPTISGTTPATGGPTGPGNGGPGPTTSTGSPSDPSPPPTGAVVSDLLVHPAASRGRVGSDATLTVVAVDAAGEPVPGAAIEWSSAGVGAIGRAQMTTDDLGRATAVISSESPGTQTVTVSASSCASGTECSGSMVRNYGPRICEVFGTSGDDLIEASTGRDVICAFSGNDVVLASGGRDLVLGGRGNDRIYGEAGADRLLGNGGSDEIRGGIGDDVLIGGGGLDLMFGGRGRDSCQATDGDDRSSCRL